MRSIRLLPLVAIALRIAGAGMSSEDREYLLVHFEMTERMLADEVRGLSPAQLEYRASEDRWTIRECVSHLAIAEPDYWRDLTKALKAPPDMKEKKSSNTDVDILWYGVDRVQHTKTGGGHEKVETYTDVREALARFQSLRATRVEYIKSTSDDMRAHSFGGQHPIDAGNGCSRSLPTLSGTLCRSARLRQTRTIRNDDRFAAILANMTQRHISLR